MTMSWKGVLPAITTPFTKNLAVDHAFLARHAAWLIEHGSNGIVALGSLGEGATLSFEEKIAVLETLAGALGRRTPLVAAVSALSTAEAVRMTKAAERAGCRGLMILPPYVYSTDWREMKAHVAAVLRATGLSCMLYNNPIAYRTDFLPEQVAELAEEFPQLVAVKESSADVRRVTAIRALLGERLEIAVGVDDLIVEGLDAGATGWVAGLVNALPVESARLFALARAGKRAEARALHHWFLPLLRMDTVPKFVQLIKLCQEAVGMGSERVRPPRLALAGAERRQALATIEAALAARPR